MTLSEKELLDELIQGRSAEDVKLWEEHIGRNSRGILDVLTLYQEALKFFASLDTEKELLNKAKSVYGDSATAQSLVKNIDSGIFFHPDSFFQRFEKLEIALGVFTAESKPDNGVCLYAASGADIAFPILMGRKEIVLVDPVLSDHYEISLMIKNLMEYGGNIEQIQQDEGSGFICVNLEGFGEINIRYYGIKVDEYSQKFPISHLLMYLKPIFPRPIYTLPNISPFILPGAFMTDNRPLDMLLNPNGFGFVEVEDDEEKIPGDYSQQSMRMSANRQVDKFLSLNGFGKTSFPYTWQFIGKPKGNS